VPVRRRKQPQGSQLARVLVCHIGNVGKEPPGAKCPQASLSASCALGLALAAPVSRRWVGYWSRRLEGTYQLQPRSGGHTLAIWRAYRRHMANLEGLCYDPRARRGLA
jgi:hypothetical protein